MGWERGWDKDLKELSKSDWKKEKKNNKGKRNIKSAVEKRMKDVNIAIISLCAKLIII